jgi:hypothetical protein
MGPQADVDTPGSIRRDGVRPTFSAADYAFGLGLKDDFLNQVLWALWYGGGLSIPDAGALLGEDFGEDISLSFDALSPPIIMPAPEGSDFDIQVGVGDAYIEASVAIPNLGSIQLSMYLSAIIGGSIDFDPVTNELLINLDNTNPEIWVQVDEIMEPAIQGNMSLLFTEVLRSLLPRLLGAVFGSIPLPSFDVGGLAGLPGSEVWELTNGGISRTPDYYRLTGSLE